MFLQNAATSEDAIKHAYNTETGDYTDVKIFSAKWY
jgi:hypothetical protein